MASGNMATICREYITISGLTLDILKMASWVHIRIPFIFLRPSAKSCVFCWWDGVIASAVFTENMLDWHSRASSNYRNTSNNFVLNISIEVIWCNFKISLLFWSCKLYVNFMMTWYHGNDPCITGPLGGESSGHNWSFVRGILQRILMTRGH